MSGVSRIPFVRLKIGARLSFVETRGSCIELNETELVSFWIFHHHDNALLVVVPLAREHAAKILDLPAAGVDSIDLDVNIDARFRNLRLRHPLKSQARVRPASRTHGGPPGPVVLTGNRHANKSLEKYAKPEGSRQSTVIPTNRFVTPASVSPKSPAVPACRPLTGSESQPLGAATSWRRQRRTVRQRSLGLMPRQISTRWATGLSQPAQDVQPTSWKER